MYFVSLHYSSSINYKERGRRGPNALCAVVPPPDPHRTTVVACFVSDKQRIVRRARIGPNRGARLLIAKAAGFPAAVFSFYSHD